MKKILFILSFVMLFGCEDVIDVDLDTAPARLVIDANINWEKGTPGNIQTILLSTSTGYYDNNIPTVSGATVYITNGSNEVFQFEEVVDTNFSSGRYTCENFVPVIGETYKLTVISNGQTYLSTEKLLATPDIAAVEQRNDLGLNNDEIGVKIIFNDIPNERNYYMLRIDTEINAFPEYFTLPDEYNQDNMINELYSHEDLVQGTILNLKLHNISERHYDYMKILIGVTNGGNDGPFQVTPSAVKGNIVNQTEPKNSVYGYFRLGETYTLPYVIN